MRRPAVREFAWNVVSNTLATSGASYVKWDANRFVTQRGSTYLAPGEQSDLLVDYNFALYDVMARMAEKFPGVTAMACSGGGGRADFGALKFFHLFWPSDNTDPRDRVKIQRGFSHFFPSDTIAAHVTKMGGRPLKFSLDVAMSGALGLDLDARKLTADEKKTISSAITLYKNEIRDVVEQGDLYRLESPYDHPRMALDYVSADRSRAVLFVYQLTNAPSAMMKVSGLDPQKGYLIHEVNLPAGQKSVLGIDGRKFDGAILLREGFVSPCHKECDSAVVEFSAVK
ncbi:MAG: alpha-galactosidase [Verrucomicrobiae bacterium]|nr:alpha-galactosidase [Verrucomicrobiae bacterium]